MFATVVTPMIQRLRFLMQNVTMTALDRVVALLEPVFILLEIILLEVVTLLNQICIAIVTMTGIRASVAFFHAQGWTLATESAPTLLSKVVSQCVEASGIG